MIEEETKSLTKFGETDSNETVTIPVFDIHSKNIGNDMEQGESQPTSTRSDAIQITPTSSKHY